MNPIPDHYLSPLHLPFNKQCLDQQFVLCGPRQDPGGAGFSLMLQGSKLLVRESDAGYQLPREDKKSDPSLYIGQWQGRPCRLLEAGHDDIPAGLCALGVAEENPELPIDLLSLGGMARMIRHWQKRSHHCGYCGALNGWMPEGWGRACTACKAHMFPAIHPCAIVLVTRPGEVLLTRKSAWAPNRYSLVAGFQDFGESLEETALRETEEETGVKACNVRYVGSQCWPFPSQVMVGYVADYESGDVRVEDAELEDARWFAVDDLPRLPPKRSIARYILDTVLNLP